MGAVTQEQASLDGDTAFFQMVDLLEENGGINDETVADYADLIGVENPSGNDMKLELAEFIDDGVAGVIAGGVPGYQVGLFCQQVHYPAFAFIPPLPADDYYC